jgi:hypothetical protein
VKDVENVVHRGHHGRVIHYTVLTNMFAKTPFEMYTLTLAKPAYSWHATREAALEAFYSAVDAATSPK